METESNEIATTLKPPEEPEAIVPMETASSLRKKKSKHKRERDRKKQGAMNTVECIQSKKACFRAAIHSEEKSTLHQEERLQPTIHSTDYPLCSLWRYSNQLSNLPTICSAISGVTPTNCDVWFTLSSDTTTNSPLCFVCRYSNRLSTVLLCLSILQLTIRSTLSGATDYPVVQLSALLSLASTKYDECYTLLCLAIPQPTLRSALPVDIPTDYPPLYSAYRYHN
jgi:hypothetical protein